MINSGVAFGWFSGISSYCIGLVLVGLMVYAVKMRELWGRVGVGLIIAGGAMNLYSRLRYGGVLDTWSFLGLLYNNLADYLIVLGVLVYGYTYIVRR